MKIPKLIFTVYLLCSWFAHATTYVWEDYDDFSGSTLDTSKWETMYFYGGDKPVISSGQVKFSSSGKSISASSEFKQGWNSSAFIDYTEGLPGSVLYVKDESIYGIEALITLPSGSLATTAICLQVGSLNPYGQHIAELMNDTGNGPGFWIHDYVADTGISTSPSNETTFKVSVINDNQKNIFYVNDTKVHELDASNFTPDWFGINTFENNGQAYSVFADNIRVLHRANTTPLDGTGEGYAPDSISGKLVNYIEGSESEITTFSSDGKVYGDKEGEWTYYTYEKVSANVGRVVYTFENEANPMPEEEILTFTSASGGTYEWKEYTNSSMTSVSDSGSGTFSLEGTGEGYAPDSISGKLVNYIEGSESEITTFSSDGKVYGDKEGEWTYYTYEKVSANVGRVVYTFENEANPMPEEEILTFTSASGGTYEWKEYTNSSMTSVSDSGSGTFSFADTLQNPDPVTVLSNPNGQAVVVQVGDEYKWNSTLDGVTLWLVGNENDSIIHATIKYEGGNYLGNFEFLEEVTNPISTLSYAINENGYLAHTESLGQQYFQILSVEEGRIGTIGFMNDLSLANHSSEPTEFFFTTRSAAEEYYYSKVNPKDWMWFDYYPWVYSNEEQDWLYFHPSGGTLMYWSNKGQAWRQFN